MCVDDHVKFVHVSDILVVLLAAGKKRSRTPSSEYYINCLTLEPTSEESSEESDDSEDSANTDSENSTDMDSDCKSFSQGMSGRFKPQHAGKKLLKLSPLKSLSSCLFPRI
jgi:hypothetical protein